MNSAGVPRTQAAGPFGYSFYQNDSASIPREHTAAASATNASAIAPAAGPALFNNQEEDYLNSFFMSHTGTGQEMTNNGFNLAIQQAANELHGSNVTNFGWLMNEQPPSFVNASATPKGQHVPMPYQPMAHHGSLDFGNHFGDGSDMLGNQAYQNMLAQAAVMQNVNMGHGQMQPPQHTPSLVSSIPNTEAGNLLHAANAYAGTPSSSQPLTNMITPSTVNALAQHSLHFAGLTPLDTVHDPRIDGGPHTAPARLDEMADNRLYRFGSDSHFGLDGFKPSSMNEQHDFIARRLTEELHMLKPINRSNVPTRASSPSHQQNHITAIPGGHSRKRSSAHFDQLSTIKAEDDDSNHISRPKKRRKDDSPSDEDDTATSPAKRKFSVPHPRRRVSSNDATLSPGTKKRRVSEAANGKAARENLSEEQKRSNHIQSEQKRRNLIKTGFDELRRLVPELRAGGLSKSMELMEVSNFLEQVIEANKRLRARLGIAEPPSQIGVHVDK